MQNQPKWLTVQQAAEITQFSAKTISSALRRGQLRGSKPGKDWRILPEDLETWFRRNQNKRP